MFSPAFIECDEPGSPNCPAASAMNVSDDCLLSIFQNLRNHIDRNSFGLTCRRWLRIQSISRRSLILHYSYETSIYQSYAMHLPAMLTRFAHLSSLSVAGCTELPDSALFGLTGLKASLRSLSLYCCLRISDRGLAPVVEQCDRLVSITLYRCSITDAALVTIANFSKMLENLDLSYCKNVTDDGINALSRGCRFLRVLVVSSCGGLVGAGLEGCSPALEYVEADCCMFGREGVAAAVGGGGLKYLNLSSPRCSAGAVDGTVFGMAPRLRFLNLRLCRSVSDDAVASISESCPLLEEWSLAVCHEVGAAGWAAIGSNCASLKVLHVNRCRNLCDRGLRRLRDGCARLQVLHIHGCGRVSPTGLELFKLRRQDVEIRGEECVSIEPSINDFFVWKNL